MEIEKKFLVKSVPDDIEKYEHNEIEQAYLCGVPALRVRKYGERFVFTYKNRRDEPEKNICIADEFEREITREAFEHLKSKADGIVIIKTRYRIPYENLIIELDIFHGVHEGLVLAEVEFPDEKTACHFVGPDWFAEDVSGDHRYTNNYLSTHTVSIQD
ncbi:MAG: CYTH domain-containing protein [Eubacterium sp.]|nr:CYTH domain-containing protein [Eubacterium sp.]